MCSGGFSRSSSRISAGKKSSATVQHRQPLASSTTSLSAHAASPQPSSSSRSMPSSPNSLTMTARRRPSACASKYRTRLVLPAPRKPVMTVAGTRRIGSTLQDERQARRDKHHAIGERGNFLIEPAGGVAEGSAKQRLRHQAHPDLVGDQHHRSGSIAKSPAELA